MALQPEIKIEGFENVVRKLNSLPDAMTTKELRIALRKSLTKGGMVRAVREEAPKADRVLKRTDNRGNESIYPIGNLKKSIGTITGKSKLWPNVQVGARAGVKRTHDGFYAHWVHEGHRTSTGSMTRKYPFITEGFNKAKNATATAASNLIALMVKRIAKIKGFR